jgi:HSP20 family protein
MANMIPQKTNRSEQAGTSRRAIATYGEFPFFLSRMRDEFDRLIERFAGEWPSLWEGAGKGWRWGLEVRDEENAIVVEAEAPGFDAGDFDLQVTDNRLVIRAIKKAETKGKEGKAREYCEQECYQSVTLPPGIDKDKVDAQYRNGMLTVTMPKTTVGKGKKVPVKSV